MKPRIILLLITPVLAAITAFGQTYEPMDLAKKIFAKESFADIQKYSMGEYQGRPNGQDLQDGAITKFMLLGQTNAKAVVAMTISDSSGRGLDTYLHFQKDTVWKMTAFRALAMTAMIEQVKNELEQMTPQQVDLLIAESKKKKAVDDVIFSSREDYQFQLGNARLTLESDENIIRHFNTNMAAFERLKNLALAELDKSKDEERKGNALIEGSKSDYQKLFISSVSVRGFKSGKRIEFLIGGILDNAVGYFYVLDKKDLPEMTASDMIMIREIGNGWYIYKTT